MFLYKCTIKQSFLAYPFNIPRICNVCLVYFQSQIIAVLQTIWSRCLFPNMFTLRIIFKLIKVCEDVLL